MQTMIPSRAKHALAHLAQQFEHWRQHRMVRSPDLPSALNEQPDSKAVRTRRYDQ
jgi:hypothetical protein